MFTEETKITTMLNKIEYIIKEDINTVVKEYIVKYLNTELEQSEKMVEYYKAELYKIEQNRFEGLLSKQQNDNVSKTINDTSSPPPSCENILLIIKAPDTLPSIESVDSTIKNINISKLITNENVVVGGIQLKPTINTRLLETHKNITLVNESSNVEKCKEEKDSDSESDEDDNDEEDSESDEDDNDEDVHDDEKAKEEEEEDEEEEDEEEEEEDEEAEEVEEDEAIHVEEAVEEKSDEEEGDAEEEEDEEDEEDEDLEVYEYEYMGKKYFITNSTDGVIFENENDEPGSKVGVFKKGAPNFY